VTLHPPTFHCSCGSPLKISVELNGVSVRAMDLDNITRHWRVTKCTMAQSLRRPDAEASVRASSSVSSSSASSSSSKSAAKRRRDSISNDTEKGEDIDEALPETQKTRQVPRAPHVMNSVQVCDVADALLACCCRWSRRTNYRAIET
jgi:hypothetical protein